MFRGMGNTVCAGFAEVKKYSLTREATYAFICAEMVLDRFLVLCYNISNLGYLWMRGKKYGSNR